MLGSAYTYDGTTEELPENNNAGLEAEFPACLSFPWLVEVRLHVWRRVLEFGCSHSLAFRRPILLLQSSTGRKSRGSAFLHPGCPKFPNTTTDKLKKNTWIQRLNEPSILDQKTIWRFLKLGVAMPDKKDPLNSGSILN